MTAPPATPAGVARPGAGGLALARELALLGAEAVVAEKDSASLDASLGFSHARGRFRDLGARMRAHAAAADPMTDRLRGRLGLSEAGCWLVLLAAAAELFPEVAAAFSLLAEDERVHLVTPAAFARLVRSALDIPFEEALCEAIAGGAAERLGLVERSDAASTRPLAQAPLRLRPEEVRRHLLASRADVDATTVDVEDSALSVGREPPAPGLGLPEELVRGARAIIDTRAVLCVRSPSARVGRQLAIDVASVGGEAALLVAGGDEPPDAAEVARLRGGLPVVDLFAACHARSFPDAWVRSVARHLPRLVVLVPESAHTAGWPTADLADLDLAARTRIFAAGLAAALPAAAAQSAAPGLAARFRVSLDEVRAAAQAVAVQRRLAGAAAPPAPPAPFVVDAAAPPAPPVVAAAAIAAELLAQGARRMGRLVTHLRTGARFEDLVVPPPVREVLDDIMAFHRAGPRVHGELGLGARAPSQLGRGLSCLFSGTPGTGKTFAAQCLAGALGLNLYRIDLSQVVSKYIGETEKALSRVFEEAAAGHGVLLFDEADALFGKRSEVKDAHDRYANVEVAYLLQRMESFDGISILTTNLRSNMDTAFLRRLRFVVEFPMPDASMRRALWERSLPPRERWEPSLDLAPFVERFPLAGGDIHNIGVAAAHLAAAEPEGVVRAEHLVRATFRELEKVGLARSKDDFGPLARYLPARAAASPGGRRA
ncbi:ATP-binding protein [Sorangium cellulosum]|uniref:AAA+ ATPase domain-containing protein n=1 Tax=Sorangium cellulosum So0157-2 TaxID=1254432 RepID=S4YB10_SORCE|nr:ATP-binding protein [Sorangium cellulosum]AGP41506.1 hypothetical protein SCE1572_47690 [Sorangium cellulosum So0157-2]